MGDVVLVVCGGMGPPGDTEPVVAMAAADDTLGPLRRVVWAPESPLQVLSAYGLRRELEATVAALGAGAASPALMIWAFSAGCVGATALASYWQRQRGRVLGLFLVDGWGVPCDPAVPGYRLSHDRFTHDTSGWLGAGEEAFYADPGVPHRQLWRCPEAVAGGVVGAGEAGAWPRERSRERLSAADFLRLRSQACLHRYRENINGP